MENLLITERHLRQKKSELLEKGFGLLLDAQPSGQFSGDQAAQFKNLKTELAKINQRLDGPEFEYSARIFELGANWLSGQPAVTV